MKCKNCDNELKFNEIKCPKCKKYNFIKTYILGALILWIISILVLFDSTEGFTFEHMFGNLFRIICATVYILPSLIAIYRKHENKIVIILLNILGGWTIICWIIALLWSLKNNVINKVKEVDTVNVINKIENISNESIKNNSEQVDKYELLEKLANLKEKGIITDEEFINEKNKILK